MKWDQLADSEKTKRTMTNLNQRGISTEYYNTRNEVFNRLIEIIPPDRKVMTGGSTTLKQIGFVDFLKGGKHHWKNIKEEIMSEKDPVKQAELRKKSITSDYFLGSIHAVTETGEIIVASASGSQIPAYAYASDNVVWVVGTQKIVSNLEEGLRRIREYCLPLENNRVKSIGMKGSKIGKILIIEEETSKRDRATLIFVNEKLGF